MHYSDTVMSFGQKYITPLLKKAGSLFNSPLKAAGTVFILILIFILISMLSLYVSLPDVTSLKTANPDTTALMRFRIEQAAEEGKTLPIRQQWVAFRRFPDLLKKAVRITEDASFYQHEGIDYVELKESLKRNWEEGRFSRGGSTISQQLAKNLYLSPRKTIMRKIKEVLITRRLEKHLGKNRIFHLYLNVIEFGEGIFGIQAAARHYFNKDVDRLSLEEIVRLTAVIPRPLHEDPRINSGWLKWKAGWILEKLHQYGYISEDRYRLTMTAFRKAPR